MCALCRSPCPAGINIKADISMWLACFLGSLCTLGMLHALYGMLVTLRLLDPKLYRCAPDRCAERGGAQRCRQRASCASCQLRQHSRLGVQQSSCIRARLASPPRTRPPRTRPLPAAPWPGRVRCGASW